MSVVGIAEKANAEFIAFCEDLLAKAKTGELIGIVGVVQQSDEGVLQTIEGDIFDLNMIIGHLHVMTMQMTMIEAQSNIDEGGDESRD